jgi:hypothetical protein
VSRGFRRVAWCGDSSLAGTTCEPRDDKTS